MNLYTVCAYDDNININKLLQERVALVHYW